jgi:acetate kinase
MSAAAGGIDRLAFTGGIGEHSDKIRAMICIGLAYLGIVIDPARNRDHAPTISSHASRVEVNVIPTNENLMLARHAVALLDDGRMQPCATLGGS